MTGLAAPALTVGNGVWTLLGGTVDLMFTAGAPNLFRGRVDDPPLQEDGTVEGYAVLYSSPGLRSGSRLGATRDRFDGTFQITCVGADDEACLWVVDEVTGRVTGKQIATGPDGSRKRRIVEDLANQSRSVIRDESVQPPRFYVPLLFRIRA